MNAALMSLLSKFMSDGDAKKAKEEDRKYRESLIQKDWERDDAKTAEERAYRESIAKQNRELAKQEKSAEELRKLKQTTLDNTWLEAHYPRSAADVNANTLELVPDVSKQLMEDARKREVAVRDFGSVRPIIAPTFQGTNEQGALTYPSLEGAAAARTGAGIADIAQGIPERQAVNQRLSLALGGQSPSEAFSKEYFPTVDLSGKTTMQRNPYYGRMNPDPMAGMVGGNNVLKSVADQLGLPQYPMEFGPDGVPVQRKRPATATPAAEKARRDSLFGGNLAVGQDEVIDYGKITPEEALKAQGLIVNKDGTISAPKKERAPLGFSNRDSGFSGMVNLMNPNSPYNIVNRIYGSQGMGIGDAYVTGTRELTEEEKELERQKARKVLNKVY